MIVPFNHVLILALILFLMGAACAATRRNLIMILIGIEIMFNAAGIAFIAASLKWRQPDGQAFFIFILAVTAAEVAVGLALVVYAYRRKASLNPDSYELLKG